VGKSRLFFDKLKIVVKLWLSAPYASAAAPQARKALWLSELGM
jgi:hypothetical protein